MIKHLVALCWILWAASVQAHETTRSYLTLTREGATVSADLRVAFRDIEVTVWLDADLDGQITWGEARERQDAIVAYLTARLTLTAGGACTLALSDSGASFSGGVDYLDLALTGTCPQATTPLTLASAVFLDIDPDHRMFVTAPAAGQTINAMLRASDPQITLTPQSGGWGNTFLRYLQAGADHLLGGADHIVFLLVLILPAIHGAQAGSASAGSAQAGSAQAGSAQAGSARAGSARAGSARAGSPSGISPAIGGVLAAITGFTLAHALTLTAAATHVLRPPTGLIECFIALSIILTAIDNIWPFIPAPRAAVAAIFGLFHGFGFASALDALHLQGSDYGLALLGFNLGIEAAQVGLVLVLFGPLYLVSRSRWPLLFGSTAAMMAGGYWLVLRAGGVLAEI